MITSSTVIWVIAGVLTGGVHSAGIKHSASSTNHWVAAAGLFRLSLIGIVLTLAAISGFLFPAATGWIIGLTVSLTYFCGHMS